ncbi:site-specific DNA-methyltransferase [Chitinilyticum litopenaei]|uniref:site-specific DNA-methyltransferase n=1 Tax=Chitinilyticum litopenaei TaxID=1121276 RepID=UPI0004145120|nr:site-specific DNA-methyltransferase [Chitinilyticum litopenaei]
MSHDQLLAQLEQLNPEQLRRVLAEHLTERKLGLRWEANLIERDAALNADLVYPRLVPDSSHNLPPDGVVNNLIIEGDNFDALRLLRATHRGQVRVIYIDPPYNTGNKDWVYNDHYVGANDKYRHSQWLEFLYQRLTLARDLLTSDGVLLVSINDENRARLELLLDEVMPGRRVGSLVWKKRRASNAAGLDNFFSCDHEHVLVYGGAGFKFLGSAKNWDKYDQWDDVQKDWWASTQLTLGFTKEQRKNLFYPLHNPETDIWYPCNPNRVWARATAARLNGKEVRTETMEELVSRNGVNFPEEKSPAYYTKIEDLLADVREGKAPPHLGAQDDLEFWLFKKIGFYKPRFKTFKSKVQSDAQPLSSWIAELGKDGSDDIFSIASGQTSEGSKNLKEIGIGGEFSYPKPLSLIKNLLQQATRPGDIVLDFFAGSGTTGQAVLELNAEDDGGRRFILCSSTEATAKEPQKNLCREVCAERIRRVMQGYGGKPGLGGSFAYLQLDKIEAADVLFDATPEHAAQLLSLQHNRAAFAGISLQPNKGNGSGLIPIAFDGQAAVLLLPDPDEAALAALLALPAARLVVYSPRPETVRQLCEDAGRPVVSYSLHDALLRGQQSKGRAA